MRTKYFSAFKISLLFFIIGSIYIFLSDRLVLQLSGDMVSPLAISTYQSYKGIFFIFLTSLLLFLLIQREINKERKHTGEVIRQKENLAELSRKNEEFVRILKERNAYIETILKNLPIGVAVNNIREGNRIFMNDKFTETYGWTKEDFPDVDSFFNKIQPDPVKREKMKTRFYNDIKNADSGLIEWKGLQVLKNNGEKGFVNAVNIPMPDQDLMISTAIDVTESYKAQKKIEENEAKFETLFNYNPTSIIITGFNDGLIRDVNDSFCRLTGHRKEELIGQSIFVLSAWENISEREEILSKLHHVDGPIEHETRINCKNGQKTDTRFYLQQVDLNGDKVIVSIVLDITERKKSEIELEKSRSLMERTLNGLSEAVLVVNPYGRYIITANAAVEKIFGYKPKELIGKKTLMLHVSEKHFQELETIGRPELEKKGYFSTTFQMKHKDGHVIDTEINTTVIVEKDGWRSGLISIIRDITKRVETERKLAEYRDSLKQLTTESSLIEEKQRKDIAANIHDHLSQLLVTSLMKMKELAKHTKDKHVQQDLNYVIGNIATALENSRKITYDLSPPVLYELGLVETMYWLTEKISAEQNIVVDFKTDTEKFDLPEYKLIMIYRIIQELINNVIKHARADKLEILFNKEKQGLFVQVNDNGIGFKADGISDTKIRESRFGLFAVRERVNNLGGKFNIQSVDNKGTQITFTVPV